MIRMSYLNFPSDHADELGHVYASLPHPPEFIKVKGVYLNTEHGHGMQVMAMYEFDEDKTQEALKYLDQRYESFGHIPGTEYQFSDWIDTQDLLQLVFDGKSVTDLLESMSLSF